MNRIAISSLETNVMKDLAPAEEHLLDQAQAEIRVGEPGLDIHGVSIVHHSLEEEPRERDTVAKALMKDEHHHSGLLVLPKVLDVVD